MSAAKDAPEREIPREPALPSLTPCEIAEIGRTVFASHPPKPSDALFVFGAPSGDWALAAGLFHRGLAPRIVVTGRDEAPAIAAALVALQVPEKALIVEDASTHTLDNARFGRRALEDRGIAPSSILFVCKSHHAGRALRTLRQVFPHATLSCASYDGHYDGVTVRAADWWTHPTALRRVYGEYQRIRLYAARGDIAPL